jgi:hypothetical protein
VGGVVVERCLLCEFFTHSEIVFIVENNSHHLDVLGMMAYRVSKLSGAMAEASSGFCPASTTG